MTLPGFALRNATAAWWRSLTLGLFLFVAVFTAVVAGSLGMAIRDRVDGVLDRGLTGHIQVRSDRTLEADMVEQYDAGWDDIAVLPPGAAAAVLELAGSRIPGAVVVPRVRRSVSLFRGSKRETTMMIGAPAASVDTTEAFLLSEGRPLSGSGREVLLTREQAGNLRAKVGDAVTMVTRNRDGRTAVLEFTVAGIGDFIMLSLFSYKACFVDIGAARELAGLEAGESTDLLITLPRREEALARARELARACGERGVPAVVQADERLASADLHSEEGLLESQKKEPEKVRISTWRDMGKTYRGIGEAIFLVLVLLVGVLLLIVGLLIGNLVGLMGIERFREIGTLRAVGFPRGLVTRLFLGEILGIAALSAAAGAAAGSLAVLLARRTGVRPPVAALEFVMGRSLRPVFSPAWTAGLLLAVTAFALAAAVLPARKACSMAPSDAMRDSQGGSP